MKKIKQLLFFAVVMFAGFTMNSYVAKAADMDLQVKETQDMTVDSTVNFVNHTGITSAKEGRKVARFILTKPAIVKAAFTSTLAVDNISAVDYNYVLAQDEFGANAIGQVTGGDRESKEIMTHLEAGTYYLVTSWRGKSWPWNTTLVESPVVAQAVTVQYVDRHAGKLGNSYTNAATIPANTEITGFFTKAIHTQTYKFTLKADTKVTASTVVVSTFHDDATVNSPNNNFLIMDSKKRPVITGNAPDTRGSATSISGNLKAGTYYVVVRSHMQGIANTRLSMKKLPACKVTWKKVKKATKYKVYQYNSKTRKYVVIATTKKLNAVVSSIKSVEGVFKAGKKYKFKVCAYNKKGKVLKTYKKSVKAK